MSFSIENIQNLEFLQAGTYIGDEHKEYFSGDAALKAGGKDNTMNQFEIKVGNSKKQMLESKI